MTQTPVAPQIPGLAHVRRLGSGGYADVFLYEQLMPSRRVAVKVMKAAAQSAADRDRFAAEANAMALLEHPHIVPVYEAGVTGDDRPYLVMMYYPQASLAERAKRERFAVPEVLRIGIQIASAVETAHRAGLLHRDIKPANILTSQYGTPGLTDFGIASHMSDATDDDAGVSVPWSPVETLYATGPATVRSDVYSLAATLWHLLVGRSPFEVVDGDNSTYALMRRIRDVPARSTGRTDVPASLDRLLRAALAREPHVRPASMLALARSLQAVEQELRLTRTEIVLAAEDTTMRVADALPAPDETRLKPQ
ncbi:MAG TPA: serine/threonine protein kinase, partial [Propionibacterium sp.]|nr:serine/threonine protein kinase [Propionibacterium sp.]